MHPMGTDASDPQIIALGALVGNQMRVRAPEDTFLEDIGIVHVQIPARPKFFCYADSGVRYLILRLKVPGGAVEVFVHEVTSSMQGRVIRARAQVWEQMFPDGHSTVYIDLYQCDEPATNRVAVAPVATVVYSSAATWRHVLPPPLTGMLIAGALDMRFPAWEKTDQLSR
jgi:hypothetical protein